MKHLIVVSHFDSNSFTFAVKKHVLRIYSARGNASEVVDLYAEKYNPNYNEGDRQSVYSGAPKPAEVQKYQDLILWADHLLFIYPLWWTGFPAILKGFFDRVFTSGFAVSYIDGEMRGLLQEKTATLITLTGFPSEVYDRSGMTRSLIQTSDEGIFSLCGIKSKHVFLGNSMSSDRQGRKDFLESLGDSI